jgi:hypothetical protein
MLRSCESTCKNSVPFLQMRVRRCRAQPQILNGSADGEVIKTPPIVPCQTERKMQHIIEVTTNVESRDFGNGR